MMRFDSVWKAAHLSGMAAANSANVEMITATDGSTVYEPFPICGFAWVGFPGNTKFGRWAKKKGYASKGYPSGLWYWVSLFNMSYDLKSAYAGAFAEKLREHGIRAYSDSRLD